MQTGLFFFFMNLKSIIIDVLDQIRDLRGEQLVVLTFTVEHLALPFARAPRIRPVLPFSPDLFGQVLRITQRCAAGGLTQEEPRDLV